MLKDFRFPLILAGGLFFAAVPGWAMGRTPPKETPVSAKAPIRTLTLDECYELSLRRSEVIASAKEEIEKTKAQWLKATGEFFGDVDFVVTDFHQQTPDGGGSSSDGGVGGSLTRGETRTRKFTVSQPIFHGFKSLGALTGAGSLTGQRVQEHLHAQDLLFLAVASAFYQVLSQQKDVETIEEIHKLFEERIADLKERERIGRSRASEVATARTQMKVLEAELAASRGALAIAEQILEFYTGIPAEEVLLDDREQPRPVAEENFSELAKMRPDIEALRKSVKTAKRAIIVAQSDLWPQVDLDHNHYERREGFQSRIDWDLLFTVKVPISTGGTTFGNIKEAVSNWKQAKLAYSFGKRKAELEIKESFQNWVTAENRSKSLSEALKSSEENFRLQKEDYERNLVSNLDVLAALEVLFNTSRNANKAHFEMKEYYWRFQTATGRQHDFLGREVENV